METLSSSIPTLKFPTNQSTTISRELTRLKPSNNPSHSSNRNLLSSISDKPTNTKHLNQTILSSSPSSSLSPSLGRTIHRNPATGYAVALLDKAQLRNSVDLVGEHVGRLLDVLRSEKEKGRVVNALTGKGLGLDRDLVRLVRMLVAKNKSGIVREVLEEFERVYDEMSGTRHVSVSSAKKMEREEILGFAERVKKLSGASRVKIRNVVWG